MSRFWVDWWAEGHKAHRFGQKTPSRRESRVEPIQGTDLTRQSGGTRFTLPTLRMHATEPEGRLIRIPICRNLNKIYITDLQQTDNMLYCVMDSRPEQGSIAPEGWRTRDGMCPFRARALEKDFPYGEQPRQRRPGLEKLKRQMPSCRTQLAILRAPRGAGAPCGLRVPTRKVTRPGLMGAPSTRNLARPPRGAGAPCGLRAPTRKVTRPGLVGAPSTRNLARPPGRRRPVWPLRPNPQSYTAKPRGRDLNSQSCAPPGAPAPRVASAPQPAKLHGQASWARPQLAILRAPGAPAPRVASAPQPAKLHGQASWARPQLAILRAPRGAGAPCGLRAPTRKATSATALSEVPKGVAL